MGTKAESVVKYARDKKHHKVGNGECWTLAEEALKKAGAQTSRDIHGKDLGKTVDYVWGDLVTLGTAAPGDIIQFLAGFSFVKRTDNADGAWREETWGPVQKHHTAIVDEVIVPGVALRILHQNWSKKKKVVHDECYFKDRSWTGASGEKNKVTAYGKANIYRPRKRP